MNHRIRFAVLALCCALAIPACGDEEDGENEGAGGTAISDQDLSGTVGGAPWAFVSGDTDVFLSDDDRYFAVLYGEDIAVCGFGTPAGPILILNIPTSVGSYPLSLTRNMTFVVEDEEGDILNVIGVSGTIVVSEITETMIRGGIVARAEGNEVNGQFEVAICPY